MRNLKKCKTDTERWVYLMNTDNKGLTAFLDNDDTFITSDTEEGIVTFDEYVGCAPGLESLFAAVGINADPV